MEKLNNRVDFCRVIDELNFKKVAEVGVREGYFSKYILRNSSVEKLYAIDPWEINSELMADPGGVYITCKNNLKEFGDRAEIIKGYSPSVSEMFDDESLDYVYIDGLHDYDSVKADIEAWYQKIKKGGILSGHDYHQNEWPGVFNSVNEFVEKHGLELNLTGCDGRDYPDNCYDGAKPSWWFFKK